MHTVAVSNQWFSLEARPAKQTASLSAFRGECIRPQGWRAVRASSAQCLNYIRLESATLAYFHSLTEEQMADEKNLAAALGDNFGTIDFNE